MGHEVRPRLSLNQNLPESLLDLPKRRRCCNEQAIDEEDERDQCKHGRGQREHQDVNAGIQCRSSAIADARCQWGAGSGRFWVRFCRGIAEKERASAPRRRCDDLLGNISHPSWRDEC